MGKPVTPDVADLCPRHRAEALGPAEGARSYGEFWRPTAWGPNPTPSLMICIPSLCGFIFSPIEDKITALTDKGCQENEVT